MLEKFRLCHFPRDDEFRCTSALLTTPEASFVDTVSNTAAGQLGEVLFEELDGVLVSPKFGLTTLTTRLHGSIK